MLLIAGLVTASSRKPASPPPSNPNFPLPSSTCTSGEVNTGQSSPVIPPLPGGRKRDTPRGAPPRDRNPRPPGCDSFGAPACGNYSGPNSGMGPNGEWGCCPPGTAWGGGSDCYSTTAWVGNVTTCQLQCESEGKGAGYCYSNGTCYCEPSTGWPSECG